MWRYDNDNNENLWIHDNFGVFDCLGSSDKYID